MALLTIFLWIVAHNFSFGQAPATNVVIFDLEMGSEAFTLSNKTHVTQNNGYNNQPFFESNSSILYTTNRDGDQTEIYRYNIEDRSNTRLTFTDESEYSPIVIPGTSDFSVVRVEADDSTQRIWSFRSDGKNPRLVMESVQHIGYHTWIDYQSLALFILGKKFSLQVANVQDEKTERLANNIGRSIHLIPGSGEISYIDKTDSTNWLLRAYNLESQRSTVLASMKAPSEDLAWSNLGFALMGFEGKLWTLHPGKGLGWKEVADLNLFGCGNFYRLAISPDNKRLALVVFSGTKP